MRYIIIIFKRKIIAQHYISIKKSYLLVLIRKPLRLYSSIFFFYFLLLC